MNKDTTKSWSMKILRMSMIVLMLFGCDERKTKFEFYNNSGDLVCEFDWPDVEQMARIRGSFALQVREDTYQKIITSSLGKGQLKITSHTGKSVSLHITDMEQALPEFCPHIYWQHKDNRIYFFNRFLIIYTGYKEDSLCEDKALFYDVMANLGNKK